MVEAEKHRQSIEKALKKRIKTYRPKKLGDGSVKGLSREQLKVMYEEDITISDTETTGLAKGSGLTEFASIRAAYDEKKDQYYLEALQIHTLPLKPAYRDYLAENEKRAADGLAPLPYERDVYEYNINPAALQVTGTRFSRDDNDQIVQMEIEQTQLDSKGEPKLDARNKPITKRVPVANPIPFYEAADLIRSFTHHFKNDLYYNAPFDKPFLRYQYDDLLIHTLEQRFPPDLHRAIANRMYLHRGDGTVFDANGSRENNIRYLRDMARYLDDPDNKEGLLYELGERADEVEALHRFLHYDTPGPKAFSPQTPKHLQNPALFQCLLFAYRMVAGPRSSYTLDAAHESFFPGRKKRNEHSALEDILMTARVGFAVRDKLKTKGQATFPNFAEMLQILLKDADPDVQVEVLNDRFYRTYKEKKPNSIEGDVKITFSAPPRQIGPKAEAMWRFLQSLHDAREERNSRIPKHILEVDEDNLSITISAERDKSLLFNMVQKLIFYNQLLDAKDINGNKPFAALEAYDSSGTMLDIWLKGAGKARDKETLVHDTHFSSVRSSLGYLLQHPKDLEGNLALIRKIREADKRVGLVTFEKGEKGEGDRIVIKGHLRQFGEATLQLPPKDAPHQHTDRILKELDFLLKTGVIPFVQGAKHAHSEEESEQLEHDTEEQNEHPFRSEEKLAQTVSVNLAEKGPLQVSMQITPEIMHLITRNRGIEYALGKRPLVLYTMPGEIICTPVFSEDTSKTAPIAYTLSGSQDAFNEPVLMHGWSTKSNTINQNHKSIAKGQDIKRSGSCKNVLSNASWLTYRLKHIPGTFDISMHGPIISLEQEDGITIEALQMLSSIGLPFTADKKHIYLDSDQLMEDAFHWSQELGRYSPSDEDRDSAEGQFWRTLRHHIYEGALSEIRNELGGEVTIVNSRKAEQQAGTRFVVNKPPSLELVLHNKDNPKEGIDPAASSLSGDYVYDIKKLHDASGRYSCVCSPVLCHILTQHLQLNNRLQHFGMQVDSGYESFSFSGEHYDEMCDVIRRASEFVHSLNYLNQEPHAPLKGLRYDKNSHKLNLPLARTQPFGKKFILSDALTLSDKLDSIGGHIYETIARISGTKGRSSVHSLPASTALSRRKVDDKTDASNLTDMVTLIAQLYQEWGDLSEQLDSLMKVTGGKPSKTRPRLYDENSTIYYHDDISDSLKQLTLFIHRCHGEAEATTDVKSRQSFIQAGTQAKEIRARLQNMSFALYRLDEQMLALYNVVVGRHPNQGGNAKQLTLMNACSDALLQLTDAYMLQQTENGYGIAESIEQHLAMVHFFEKQAHGQFKEDANIDHAIAEALSTHYRQAAMRLLAKEGSKQETKHYAELAKELLHQSATSLRLQQDKPAWPEEMEDFVIRICSARDEDALFDLMEFTWQHPVAKNKQKELDGLDVAAYLRRYAQIQFGKLHPSIAADIDNALSINGLLKVETHITQEESDAISAQLNDKIHTRINDYIAMMAEEAKLQEVSGKASNLGENLRHMARLYVQSGVPTEEAVEFTYLGLLRSYLTSHSEYKKVANIPNDELMKLEYVAQEAFGALCSISEELHEKSLELKPLTDAQVKRSRERLQKVSQGAVSIRSTKRDALLFALDQDPIEDDMRSPANTKENVNDYLCAPLPLAVRWKALKTHDAVAKNQKVLSPGTARKAYDRTEYVARKQVIRSIRATLEEMSDLAKVLQFSPRDITNAILPLATDPEQVEAMDAQMVPTLNEHKQAANKTHSVSAYDSPHDIGVIYKTEEQLNALRFERIKTILNGYGIEVQLDHSQHNALCELPDDVIKDLTPLHKIVEVRRQRASKKTISNVGEILPLIRQAYRTMRSVGAIVQEVSLKVRIAAPSNAVEEKLATFMESSYPSHKEADGSYNITLPVQSAPALAQAYAFCQLGEVTSVKSVQDGSSLEVTLRTAPTRKQAADVWRNLKAVLKNPAYPVQFDTPTLREALYTGGKEKRCTIEVPSPHTLFAHAGPAPSVEAQTAEYDKMQQAEVKLLRIA